MTILACIILNISGNAQNFITKFGQCSQDELDLKACPFDSTADAMVLHDIGFLYFEVIGEKYQTVFERRTKIKIFNKAGIDNNAEFEIQFYKGSSGFEKVTAIKGNTYNMVNGKIEVTKLEGKNIFEEKESDQYYNKKFAMPGVKEGSVYEVSYRITSPYYFQLPSWEFQQHIPVLYSELIARMNPHFEFTFIMRGDGTLSDFQKYEDGGMPTYINTARYHDVNYKYVMKNVPAFTEEAFITSENDYMCRLDFQLATIIYSDGERKQIISTWPKLCEELKTHENFGQYIKAWEREGDEILTDPEFNTLSSIEKAKAVDKYIKTNFVCNDRNRLFASEKKKDIQRVKSGNSADLNLMAVGLLKSAGLEAYPVILSTRGHGKIQTTYPFIDAFNYVIGAVRIDTSVYIIDCSEPLLNFAEIPYKCLNDICLMIKEKDVEWLNVSSLQMSESRFDITLLPEPEVDSLKMGYTHTTSYFKALEKRTEFKTDYEGLATDLLGKDYKMYDSIVCENLTDIEKPFILNYKKEISLEKVENKIIIEPFAGIVMTENPLKQPTMKYPIDMTYKFSKTFSVDIIIPKGYHLVSKPENTVVNNKNIRIVYTVIEKDPEHINVVGLYQFKKDVYPATDYKDIKGYFDIIVSKFNEKIILEGTEI